MADANITKDVMYDAVAPDDFESMIALDRYEKRSTAFDTLLRAGLITDRTKAAFATYVDMDELKAEGDRMVGDDIAEEGIRYLQEINFKDRSNAAAIRIAAE